MNEALGRLRRRRPRADLAELEAAGADDTRVIPFPTAPAGPEAEAGRAEARRLLEQCIDALPGPLRLVLILRDVEGLSAEATAAQLGIRPETAKTRLHRARRRLRDALAARLPGGFVGPLPLRRRALRRHGRPGRAAAPPRRGGPGGLNEPQRSA